MTKAFSMFLWQNSPSVNTPLGESKLNLINTALDAVDTRVVNMDTTKANQTDLLTAVADVTYNESTGIFTVTKKNGSKSTIDTKLEKLAINFTYDSINQQLVIHLSDGTYQYVDLKALITELEFLNSNTVLFSVTDGKVTANIAQGSITADMLEPNYLANVQLYASQALQSAESAEESARNAEESAIRAEEAADRAEAIVGGDFATNEKVDNIINGTTTVGNAKKLNGLADTDFQKTVAVNAQTNTLASLFDLVPNSGKVRFMYLNGTPSDFPTNLGTPTAKGCLSVEVNKIGALGYYNINAVYASGKPFNITGYYTGSVFYWNNNADGGNADTVDGAHLSDIQGWAFSQLLKLDGSKPMSGTKLMLNNGKGHVKEDSNCIMMYTFPSGGTTNEFDTVGATGFLAYAKNYADAQNMPMGERIQCKIDNVNYKMLHTGNSVKVTISDTAPTDGLWVVP